MTQTVCHSPQIKPPDPSPWPQGEVAFLIEDADGEHARLQDAGVPVLAPPTDRPWGERTLHADDLG
jgi:lactoylglutathione lyase